MSCEVDVIDIDETPLEPPPIKRVKLESANGHAKPANSLASLPKVVTASIENVVAAVKGKVTKNEFEKVKAKLMKRRDAMADLEDVIVARFLDKKALEIKDKPDQVFKRLKEILDELARYGNKKEKNGHSAQPEPIKSEKKEATTNGKDSVENKSEGKAKEKENGDRDTKRKLAKQERHIKKLEKALRQCGRKIQEMDEAELDLEDMDDENSPYLMMTRYQKRFVTIHKKIAELRKLNASLKRKADKRVKIETSRIPEVNAKIEEMINRKKQFPDFADVHGFYKTVNEKKNLGMKKEIVYHDAKETFISVGKLLKSRRIHDYEDTMESYFTVGVAEEELEVAKDPAEEDELLNSRLKTQQEEGKFKLEKLLDEYSRKQIEMKEEPEVVPDDEPAEKPSDDEEEEDPLPEEPENGEEPENVGEDPDSILPGDEDENPDGTLGESNQDSRDESRLRDDSSSSSDSSSEGEENDESERENNDQVEVEAHAT